MNYHKHDIHISMESITEFCVAQINSYLYPIFRAFKKCIRYKICANWSWNILMLSYKKVWNLNGLTFSSNKNKFKDQLSGKYVQL